MADKKAISLDNLKTYNDKIKELYSTKTDLSNSESIIESNVITNLQPQFFTKDECVDYLNSKMDGKVDKVDGRGLSQNDFTDDYKNKLDAFTDDDLVRDENYIHSDNNFTNYYKDKIDSMSSSSTYIGLFEDLNARDSYSEPLVSGYWCTINSDSDHENRKTKYYYNGTDWKFDGIYTDDEFLIDDSATDSESLGWSTKKLTTELNKKANKLDVDTSIDEINDKLDKKLEITNLKAGTNISIDTDQYGNATINATGSGTGADGTSDFEMLSNKPKINGITIIGEKTSKDLGLLDSSYASEENEGSVKLADKAKEVDIEGQLDGTAKYYGVTNGGTSEDNTLKLRPFPVGLATERIDTLDFAILTKDVPQSIPFAREIPTVNCFVQAFKQEEAELNVTDVFEDYNNELVSNHSENINCDVSNGLSIKDKYEYKSSLNDDGIYETDLISKNDFIEILSIKCN